MKIFFAFIFLSCTLFSNVHEHGYWVGTDILHEHKFDRLLASALSDFFKSEGAESIVDFGSGTGEYLKILRRFGYDCEGYDGNPDSEKLTNGLVKVLDLSQPFDLGKQFDWVLCIEVGEHLPKEFEKTLIENLDRHAKKGIVLSWAVKGQGGYGHFNEQDNDYVKNLMASYGYQNDVQEEKALRRLSSLFWFKNSLMVFRKKQTSYVEAELRGQLGNNMFIVATASSLAWDQNAQAHFPELTIKYPGSSETRQSNLEHIFFRCNLTKSPQKIDNHWHERNLGFHQIPYQENMKVHGYCLSEKYFAHNREQVLQLFAPHADDLHYIQNKYKHVLEHSCSVGVQLRRWEDLSGKVYIQYGHDYLKKAMKLFPSEALFVICSDDIPFAKRQVPKEYNDRVIFVEGEPHHVDLHLLALCKHNIISNSTFGWWGAWLNKNPNKVVIVPKPWLHPETGPPIPDIVPSGWTEIEAKWGKPTDEESFQ